MTLSYRRALIALAAVIGLALVPVVGVGSASHDLTERAASQATRAPSGSDEVKEFGVDHGAAGEPRLSSSVTTTSGTMFYPINPYRTFDSRDFPGGYLMAGTTIHFDVITEQTGTTAMIPWDAVAVTYNLTVTNTWGRGYVSVFPANIAWPGTSSINWTGSDQTLANGGVVALGARRGPGEVRVHVAAGGSRGTDVILDITGYYR